MGNIFKRVITIVMVTLILANNVTTKVDASTSFGAMKEIIVHNWGELQTVVEINDYTMVVGDATYDAEAGDDELNEYEYEDEIYLDFYLLNVEKGRDEDEIIQSFQYTELSKETAKMLLQNGPCMAYITYYEETDYHKEIESVLFYTETEVGKDIQYSELISGEKILSIRIF